MMDRQITRYGVGRARFEIERCAVGCGISMALFEIERRAYIDAEERLREKMKPARLAPLAGLADGRINFSHINGDAASDAVIARMRSSLEIPPAGFIKAVSR